MFLHPVWWTTWLQLWSIFENWSKFLQRKLKPQRWKRNRQRRWACGKPGLSLRLMKTCKVLWCISLWSEVLQDPLFKWTRHSLMSEANSRNHALGWVRFGKLLWRQLKQRRPTSKDFAMTLNAWYTYCPIRAFSCKEWWKALSHTWWLTAFIWVYRYWGRRSSCLSLFVLAGTTKCRSAVLSTRGVNEQAGSPKSRPARGR